MNIQSNYECELSVLSSCLRSAEDAVFFSTSLDVGCFSDLRNRILFDAVKKTLEESGGVDAVEVSKIAGEKCPASYIAETMSAPVAVSREFHCRELLEKKAARELETIIRDATEKLHGHFDNFENTLCAVKEAVLGVEVESEDRKKSAVQIDRLINEQMDRLDALKERGRGYGIPSGFADLDFMTDGFQKSDLIVLAGRPSMGKTALAVDFARNMAFHSPGLYLSLEMGADQLADRLVAPVAGVNLKKFRDGDLKDHHSQKIKDAQLRVAALPIFVDDDPAVDIGKVYLKLVSETYRHKIKWMIVDYIQLMDSPGRSREEEVSTITRKLKRYAKEFQIPIIALAQLNRKCEERGDKKPMLSDLRESGAIEQDADVVIFVWRGGYYFPGTAEYEGRAELLIRKHRNGPIGDVELAWRPEVSSFGNLQK